MISYSHSSLNTIYWKSKIKDDIITIMSKSKELYTLHLIASARYYKNVQYSQMGIIVLSVVNNMLAGFKMTNNIQYISLVVFVLTLIITISAAVVKYFNFEKSIKENEIAAQKYRIIFNKISRELNMIDDDDMDFRVFVDEIYKLWDDVDNLKTDMPDDLCKKNRFIKLNKKFSQVS